MGKPKNASSTLTHEEIWDDSALVRSWDEAVEEYQLYHSIHAKGENVEDVLKEAEAAGLAGESDPLGEDDEYIPEDVVMEAEAENEVQPERPVTAPTQNTDTPAEEIPEHTAGSAAATAPDPTLGPGSMPMPGPVLSNVQDENLKRLMMSWYFAGYYTGLYEGQQKAQSKS